VLTNQSATLQLLFVWTAVITGSEVVAFVREKDAMFGRSEMPIPYHAVAQEALFSSGLGGMLAVL
jgi:hypothetical protein